MLVTLDLQAILYTKYAHISMNFHPTKYQASGPTNSLDIAEWKCKKLSLHCQVCTSHCKHKLLSYRKLHNLLQFINVYRFRL